jgi:CRP-like cAMP-binding protein
MMSIFKKNLFLYMVNSSTLLSAFAKHVALSEEESNFLLSVIVPQRIKQGEVVESAGEVTRYFIYVGSGCLLSYYTDKQGNEHVIQFAMAGWWTGDIHSYTKGLPSIFTTKALTDSEVWLIPKASLDLLLEKYPKFERYFRIIFQNSLVTHQSRLMQSYSATAEERYLSFREKYPTLEQYIPQKYIASYLGMTPEFLSKIRRKLMEK